MVSLKIRIDLGKEAELGPGKTRLLELVDETGSIRKAAAAMGMSYRRAWLLLHEVEAIMGAPVIAAETGGRSGGGATLTDLGRAVAEAYRRIEQSATRSVADELRDLAKLAKGRAPRVKHKPRSRL